MTREPTAISPKPGGRAVVGDDAASRPQWYRDGLCFTCTQCGNCCTGAPGYVWVTKEEMRRIAEFLGRADGRLGRKHVRRVRLLHSLTEKEDGDCIFLNRAGGVITCAIYPVRPLQCRTWPFWKENLASLEGWNHAHAKCPGMNTGHRFSFEEIEAIRMQKEW